MRQDQVIAIFAYAFPHRKTQDILQELAYAGCRNAVVIAAPWRALAHSEGHCFFRQALNRADPAQPRKVSQALGFEYHELSHDAIEPIRKLVEAHGIELGIIAGARILNRFVIELFDEGILNLHPGKIPETSGLDTFYYTIKRDVPLGVTAHYIDHRIDAGQLLFLEETRIGPEDTAEIVTENNYQSQIRALRRFLALRDAGAIRPVPALRPTKNQPMAAEEKRRMIERFPFWRAKQVLRQSQAELDSSVPPDAGSSGHDA